MIAPERSDLHRHYVRRLVASTLVLGLILGGFAICLFTPATWLGFGMLSAAIVIRLVLNRLSLRVARAAHASAGDQWWYVRRTGTVERGFAVFSSGRDGPFATAEDAARAPEIARARAAQWNAED
jgi:hypothetical protein